jgi:outer membrane protein
VVGKAKRVSAQMMKGAPGDCCRGAHGTKLAHRQILNGSVIQFRTRIAFMLRKLSLAIAVSCASNGVAWAADAPQTVKTDLVSVYQEAVDNNADLAAARADYGARREVVPQARAGLLPNLSAGAEMMNTRTKLDEPSITSNRSGNAWSATLAQPIFRADRWFQLQAAEAVN